MEIKAFELKQPAVTAEGRFTGRASVYFDDAGRPFEDSDHDVIVPGAFTNTIKASKGLTKILVQHEAEKVVGTGLLRDTPTALMIDGALELELSDARDAYVRLRAGLVDGLSIGFNSVKEQYTGGVRMLKEIDLFEVSLVTWGANALARIESVKRRGPSAEHELRTLLDALKSANIQYRNAKEDEARELREALISLRFTRLGINLDRLIDTL